MGIEKTRYISVEDAITLHILLMRGLQEVRFGVDRRDLLESALNRPRQAFNFESADLVRQSATLCYGLIKNHPWLGGNKRTATYIMDTFLQVNGVRLKTSDREVIELALNVEADRWEVDQIETWILERIA